VERQSAQNEKRWESFLYRIVYRNNSKVKRQMITTITLARSYLKTLAAATMRIILTITAAHATALSIASIITIKIALEMTTTTVATTTTTATKTIIIFQINHLSLLVRATVVPLLSPLAALF